MTQDELLIAVAVWLVCATVCGFLAPSKGRKSGDWFVYGLVFSVFALIALAFLERREPAPEPAARICPHCGKAIDRRRERYCDHCGQRFDLAGPAAP